MNSPGHRRRGVGKLAKLEASINAWRQKGGRVGEDDGEVV